MAMWLKFKTSINSEMYTEVYRDEMIQYTLKHFRLKRKRGEREEEEGKGKENRKKKERISEINVTKL